MPKDGTKAKQPGGNKATKQAGTKARNKTVSRSDWAIKKMGFLPQPYSWTDFHEGLEKYHRQRGAFFAIDSGEKEIQLFKLDKYMVVQKFTQVKDIPYIFWELWYYAETDREV